MRMTHEYVEWKDFGGFKFWTEDQSHMIDTNQNDKRQRRVSSADADRVAATAQEPDADRDLRGDHGTASQVACRLNCPHRAPASARGRAPDPAAPRASPAPP